MTAPSRREQLGPGFALRLVLPVVWLGLFLALMVLTACQNGNRPVTGLVDAQLAPCPASPNCVSSDTDNAEQHVQPFALARSPQDAWALLIDQVSRLPRSTIVTQEPRYLHVECRSRLFGFVDDLEFHLRPVEQVIAVRSAARTGYADFGVNRERVEGLRQALQSSGVLR